MCVQSPMHLSVRSVINFAGYTAFVLILQYTLDYSVVEYDNMATPFSQPSGYTSHPKMLDDVQESLDYSCKETASNAGD